MKSHFSLHQGFARVYVEHRLDIDDVLIGAPGHLQVRLDRREQIDRLLAWLTRCW